VFTTKGAAIKQWKIKEHNGRVVDLVSEDSLILSTFDDTNFEILEQTADKIVFSAVLADNKKITKTYRLADEYLNTLSIDTDVPLKLVLGQGLGTDDEDKADNVKLTRALALPADKLANLKI